jgi:DNA polymerase-3 subunit delta'
MMEAAPKTAAIPEAVAEATRHQPRARAALVAALGSPGHAYIFRGPRGAGKAAAARAFAAELLTDGAPDPDDARRRALLDPSPHPDLAWLRPPGAQHLVEDVRESVIRASSLSPAEGRRRVFVIEEAEDLRDESQNALLKTLEEPAPYAHILLLTAEPAALLDTVRSRCQTVRFNTLPLAAVEARLAELAPAADANARRAAARLAGNDSELAAELLVSPGSDLREAAMAVVGAASAGDLSGAPWRGLLALSDEAGEQASTRARDALAAAAEEAGETAQKRGQRSAEDAVRRAARQARTAALDTSLALMGAWLRDLVAAASGAEEAALNCDRLGELRAAAEGIDARRARRAGEVVMDTRRRLRVNVGEELALETLAYRLEALLHAA